MARKKTQAYTEEFGLHAVKRGEKDGNVQHRLRVILDKRATNL